MREEIHAAATWLATAIAGADYPQHDDIVDALSQALTARFADHWYVSEPHRGCAFRAVECTRFSLDPLVERALKESPAHLDTHRLHRLLCKRNAEDVRLWTTGEVKAATSNKSDNVVKILTADAMVDVNPYSSRCCTSSRRAWAPPTAARRLRRPGRLLTRARRAARAPCTL